MSESRKLNLNENLLKELKFDGSGLMPAVAQHYRTGEILMLAYMNRESLEKTFETGKATYWSRSRKKLWMKGETSGHVQQVKQVHVDCDSDSLILLVDQTGPACHTGEHSCFYRVLADNPENASNASEGCAGCGGGSCCG
jgi:phosphoribosyl-AMP cyclohydrolase